MVMCGWMDGRTSKASTSPSSGWGRNASSSASVAVEGISRSYIYLSIY